MPPSPEFGNISGEIGEPEVAEYFEAEQLCGSNGNIRIATEVPVNLDTERKRADEQGKSVVVGIVAKALFHYGCKGIGNHHLFEHPPKNQPAALHCL